MKDTTTRRTLVFRLALALLATGGAVFFSPGLVRDSAAQQEGEVTCTATCGGGSCTGNKAYCVCSCSWFWQTPVCNCTDAEQRPVSPTQS